MKLTKENLNKLLNSIAIQNVEIVDDGGDDFNPETTLDNYLNSKEPVFRAKYEESVLPEKIKEVAGQIGGKLRNAIKKASGNQITAKDLEGKDDSEAIQMLADTLLKSGDHSAEEVRKQLGEVIENHNREIETLKNDYEGKISEQNQKFQDLNMDGYFKTIVQSLPLLGDDDDIKVGVLKQAIKSKYATVWNDEKKAVELRDKENPEKQVLKGNAILEPKTYAEEMFKSLGMVKTDTRTEHATDHMDRGTGEPAGTDSGLGHPGLGFQNLKI